jgi:hypothetical protein
MMTPMQAINAAYRRGDVERALALAGEQVALAAQGDFSPHAVLCEVLQRAGRIDELNDFLDLAEDFQQDPRAQLMRAKVARRSGDPAGAINFLQASLAQGGPAPVRRIAHFEMVAALESLGRHTESWQAASRAHEESARAFPTDQLVAALRVTADAPAAELAALPKALAEATRSAVILGLPRSGTTLLEQMLDCHTRIHGVGELPLSGRMTDAIAREGGGWPVGAMRVSRKTLSNLQQHYLEETRSGRQLPGDVFTLDKTVFPMMQPLFIAGVLPGAKVLRITRDARDNAVSVFLNNFDPSWGWTASLDGIRQVIEAERKYVPVILEKLQLDVVTLRFEDLVDDPEAQLRRVLGHMGLPWEPACLQPQDNDRLVFTLSHEQVRRPLNRQGIGRWQQHAEHFDAEWDALEHGR